MMVTKRDFICSTTQQAKSVDALLECGFYPSCIGLDVYNVEMQYCYKNRVGETCPLVIVVYPDGKYKLNGLRVVKTMALEQVVNFFQRNIASGMQFNFFLSEEKDMEIYTLNNAVKMTLSEDYRERFIAEYVETKIRYERLHNIIIKWYAGKADFVTDIDLLEEQAQHMGNSLKILEIRAVKENIELPNVDWRK